MTPNTPLESIRCRVGLSRPQFIHALDGDQSMQHAQQILRQYEQWKATVLQTVAARSPIPIAELARILGCDRFKLYQAKRRGTIEAPRPTGRRAATVSTQTVQKLFDLHEQAISRSVHVVDHSGQHHTAMRGPLAAAFLAYLDATRTAQADKIA